jgi:hypothetical protein
MRLRANLVAIIGCLCFLEPAAACAKGGPDPRGPFCERVAVLQEVLRALPPGSTLDVKLVEQELSEIEVGFADDAAAFRQRIPALVGVATELSRSIDRLRMAAATGGNVTVAEEELSARVQQANSRCV